MSLRRLRRMERSPARASGWPFPGELVVEVLSGLAQAAERVSGMTARAKAEGHSAGDLFAVINNDDTARVVVAFGTRAAFLRSEPAMAPELAERQHADVLIHIGGVASSHKWTTLGELLPLCRERARAQEILNG